MKFQGLLLAAVLGTSAYAGDNHEVGNGGDGLRKIFRDAKNLASGLVKGITPCGLNGTTEVNNWIKDNHVALAEDILGSDHKWVVDSQDTCAFTTYDKKAPLYLSYEQCGETTRDAQDAMYVVIHESVHHLGVRDNTMVDNIVEAIMRVEQRECPDMPMEVYFKPGICPGSNMDKTTFLSYFSPGTNQALYGNMQYHARFRTCHTQTGCQDWRYASSTDGAVNLKIDRSGQHLVEPNFGENPHRFEFEKEPDFSMSSYYDRGVIDSGGRASFSVKAHGGELRYGRYSVTRGSDVDFKINAACAHFVASSKWEYESDAQWYDEVQVAGYSGDR